jgi:hypothetical protein
MKNFKLLIVLVVPLFGFKCISKKMRQNFIQVENHLPLNVYCIPSYNHPDTTLTFTDNEHILANDSIYFVSAFHTKRLFYLELCRIETWNRLIKSDSLQIFVFEEAVIKERSWDKIKANRLYLRRLTYAYDDIVNKGCKITIR